MGVAVGGVGGGVDVAVAVGVDVGPGVFVAVTALLRSGVPVVSATAVANTATYSAVALFPGVGVFVTTRGVGE